jgi:hypothetical protein
MRPFPTWVWRIASHRNQRRGVPTLRFNAPLAGINWIDPPSVVAFDGGGGLALSTIFRAAAVRSWVTLTIGNALPAISTSRIPASFSVDEIPLSTHCIGSPDSNVDSR